jgi:4-amino-4-deoxy-L-arabinose transferase-like glycosyltransferase
LIDHDLDVPDALTSLPPVDPPAAADQSRSPRLRLPWARDPFPWLAIGLALAASGLLLAFIGADPTRGITGSQSPFTDEAWNVVNARNQLVLGMWSTDQFNLHLVNGPFSLLEAGIFSVLGVGIVQARLLSIVSIGLTTLLLGVGLRSILGRGPALLAAAAFGSCFLVLFYGRLAYTESLVALAMTAGVVVLVRAGDGAPSGRWGFVAGILFGLAIATKAIAIFGLAGALVAIALVDGRRSPGVRRSLVGAMAGLAVVAVAWLAIVFVPGHDAVLVDLRIWPHQQLPRSIGQLVGRIASYPFRTDGALPGLTPLAAGAALGVAATVAGWRSLSPTTRRLAVAAIGWGVVHLGVLLVSSYRPNRYLVPLVPAAVILVGVAAQVVRDRPPKMTLWRPRLATSVALVAIAALIVPGLVTYGRWMTRATRALEPMQSAVAGILPAGATVWGGFAPLVAMTAPVTTIVPWPEAPANVSPAYRSLPVHWVVSGTHDPPWIVPNSPAWAARQQRACFAWNASQVCLYELP